MLITIVLHSVVENLLANGSMESLVNIVEEDLSLKNDRQQPIKLEIELNVRIKTCLNMRMGRRE